MKIKNRLIAFADWLNSSYWFIPALMAVLAILLSQLAIQLDEYAGPELVQSTSFLYVDSPEGAREILSTIASSMITTAGVVFSITMVVFSLSAQKYGSFVLENYMRDRHNQIVLGTFTATFIYCLLVLRTVQGTDSLSFVPHLAVLTGVLLALAGVAVLIYFIHHVSEMIKSFNVVSRAADDLMNSIDDLFPEQLGYGSSQLDLDSLPDVNLLNLFEEHGQPIQLHQSGYLQLVDEDRLMKVTCEHDITFQVYFRPGDFVVQDWIFGRVRPSERIDDTVLQEMGNSFIIGSKRTYAQDIRFHFTRLVEIAVRALSPGINDPYTAMLCIDRLGQAIFYLGNRHLPSCYRYDDDEQLRLVMPPIIFEEILYLAFEQIRLYGNHNPEVMLHLLRTFHLVGNNLQREERRAPLLMQAELTYLICQQQPVEDFKRQEIDHVYQMTVRALGS